MSFRMREGESPLTSTASSGEMAIRSSLPLADTLRPFARRFGLAAAYFTVLFAFATVGYRVIEDWSWFDAFYMAVTTVTSVGFMEVHPLSTAGRSFTTLVIVLGVTGLGIWWALITALIVELDLAGVLRRRHKMKELRQMKDHYVICGVGRVGRMVLREMRRAGKPVVVIEIDGDRAQALEEENPELLIIRADATKEKVLEEARVESARGLAACLADDGDNLLVCLTARDLNPSLATVARAYNEESMRRLRRAGADHVISPTLTGGIRMASTLLRPHVVSFLDSAIVGPGMDLRLEEATIPEASPLAGRSLGEAAIPRKTGLVVIALQRGDTGGQIYNPGPE
ncbi:MAG: potassium channel protein, partial [Gemmatimonadetes bacterium]|nr:potassium channel protein [Gemmatimonadota bacterium]